MATEAITTQVRRLYENSFNSGDFSLVDKLIDPDYVDHSTIAAPNPGVEGFKQRISILRNTFPNIRFTVDDIFEAGGKLVFRWTLQGTDTGGFKGNPPTEKQVKISGINIELFGEGKIVEHWSTPDNLGILQQLGLLPV
jgi:predicted ester cyclase